MWSIYAGECEIRPKVSILWRSKACMAEGGGMAKLAAQSGEQAMPRFSPHNGNSEENHASRFFFPPGFAKSS